MFGSIDQHPRIHPRARNPGKRGLVFYPKKPRHSRRSGSKSVHFRSSAGSNAEVDSEQHIEYMATSASLTVPSSPNPSAQGSPRARDWSNLRPTGSGSAFRGISRGRARSSGIRGGRGSATNLGPKGTSHPDTTDGTPSPSPTAPSVLRKLPVSTSAPTLSGSSEKAINGSTERGGRPKSGSRKQSRAPTIVTSSVVPPQNPQTAPPTPSRSSQRRRRPQQGKTHPTTAKPPLPSTVKIQNPRAGPTQTILRKDVPPHLAAAHEAEIRHDIDVLVERVRAVAMAENRPTTPRSHIDWAGDEDDSLPDLDDWGVTTTHTNAVHDEDQSEEISPILEDSLKTLPEPNSEVQADQETQGHDVEATQLQESSVEPSFLRSPIQGTPAVPPTTEKSPNQNIIAPTVTEELSSPTLSDGKLPSHPSLPPKPVTAMECLRARGRSISKPSNLPLKPSILAAEEEAATTKTEGLVESIHAPSADERPALERVSSVSSSERGLAASIHASMPGLPESHSAPSLLSARPTSSTSRSHSRSKTEGRNQSHSGPASTMSHRGRSGATSPLGKHVYTHGRNHSTPAMGAGSRLPQTSRPVITGEAISKLARTIGGHGPTPRTQAIPVAKDSNVS